MKTVLEIFYLRIAGDRVRYQRRQANLSRKDGDPDRMLKSYLQEKRRDPSGKVESREFIVHSTSWRYERPDKVVLTYVAYSDQLKFERGKVKSLSMKRLSTITKKSRRPRSRAELEKKVVSHAMRHIAFLIQTEDSIDFESALTPKTRKTFEKLWVSLDGQVL